MPRKPKFRPEIRRIKLNPEQAVLQCGCYLGGRVRVFARAGDPRYTHGWEAGGENRMWCMRTSRFTPTGLWNPDPSGHYWWRSSTAVS